MIISDSTIEIGKKNKKKTNLNLIIIENIKNKGYSKNFEMPFQDALLI